MKKSLYIRICNKALGLLFLLMPYFYSETCLAGTSSLKADLGPARLVYQVETHSTSAASLYNRNSAIPDTSLLRFTGSSQYSLNNLIKKNIQRNFIPSKALAAPPTIVCPGNITTNTDPGVCKATRSGLAATVNDPDGDITTLTWTMNGATIASSPISGINNINTPFSFNRGNTTVTYRVFDAGGSTSSCSFTVTVLDKEIPSIVCPPDALITIPSCASLSDTTYFSLLSVSDNCGILNFSSNAPVRFPVGTTSVTWTTHDINGNSNQCTQVVTVTNVPLMSLNGSSTPVSCFGGNDGKAAVSVTGGSPPYTYSWNTVPVQTTETASNLLPGTYTVTVTDFYNCTASTTVTVTQPLTPVSVSVSSQANVACFGGSNGSVTVSGSGGTPGYQYSINGTLFQASATFTNLAAGTYTITVRDSKNCVNTTPVTITQPATAVTGIVSSQSNVACLGTATGSVTVSGNGGTPPYQYSLNGGPFQVSGTFGSLSAGVYAITVRDASNCTSPVVVTITQSATQLTASITSKTNVLCSGQSNGSATVTANGGTSPYSYSWNTIPVQTTATAINLAAQNYTVTVTDASGCKVPVNVTITQPSPLVASITSTNVACFGDSTGTATAIASGGVPPYSYAWLTTPIQTTATVTNLPAGTYTVAVFDSLGCFKPAFITITQPASKLIASVTGKVDVACAGSSTGSVTVSGSGGVAPIQYNINGGAFQASGTFNGLTAGSYTIVARDGNNCTVTLPVTINEPAIPLTTAISAKVNILCAGQANGTATVTASGGTPPYAYAWNTVPAQTTATAINLAAGNYTARVTDGAGCIKTASVTITQPTPLNVSITKSDIACFGDSAGTATALASGGTPPYTYAWLTTPIQTTATVTNLPAGTYTVAVFDSSGCFKPAFVTITEPASKLIATVSNVVNVACAGSSTGSIIVSGSGGVAPIQYNINGGAFQSSGTFNGLAAGSYNIIARDANNCTVNLPVVVTEPATALSASISSQVNVLCSGQADGTATVAASGGTAPYTYLWNTIPAQTTATVINLAAQNYTATVTDAAGCKTTVNLSITQPDPIIVSTIQTNVLCTGDASGSATATASGGTPPYTYAWLTTPIQTTATATNLAAGTYTVAVFDSSGCFKPAFVTITEPATKLTAAITSQVNVVCGGNTGSLTADGSGGVPPYQYNVNGGPFQVSGTFTSLSAGNYSITARDANNCTFSISATITEPADALRASITSQFNILCAGQANGSVTVTATGGNAPYTYSWATIPSQTTATANNLAAGMYIVTSRDNSGCFVLDTAFITEPLPLAATITNQVNYDCATGINGSVTVSGTGGTPGYQFSIDGGPYQLSGTFTNLPAGNYSISVKDTNNCESSLPVQITVDGLVLAVDDSFSTSEDMPLSGDVMANDRVACNLPIKVTSNTDPANGSLIVHADGTFTYTPSLNYNGTDSFSYTLTDNAGGSSSATVTITIDAVNDPPVTFNNPVTVIHNLPLADNLLLNGSFDPDGTDLTVNTTPVVNPSNGTFTVDDAGNFTYTPNLNFTGIDMVVVSICDNGLPLPPACTTDTLFMDVLPPNLPPVTVHETIALCQDGSFTGTLSNGGSVFNGDSDPENNLPLTLNPTPVQGASYGVFSITDVVTGTYNYIPDAGYSGPDFAIVGICDSGIPVECSNDTIFINVSTLLTANAGIDQKLCNSDVAVLVGNPVNTGTGSWSFVAGPGVPTIEPSTGNVAIASGLSASPTPYIFVYTIQNGACVSTDTMSVTNYTPSTPSYAGMDQQYCDATVNPTVTLAGNSPTDGTGTWTQLAGPTMATFENANDPSTNVSDLTFGLYSFEWSITNGACQASSDVVNITISQIATADAGADLSTCESVPVAITGASVQNGSSFLWTTTGNGTFSNPTILDPVYTPGSLDYSLGIVKLTLVASGAGACGDGSDFALLTINKNPIVNAGPDNSICVGSEFTISQASASDYSNIQWSVSPAAAGTLTNSETLNPTFTPTAGFTGTVTLALIAQGNGACFATQVADEMTIEINTSLVADAGNDQIIYSGTTTTLSGMVSGGTGFYAWNWQPSALLMDPAIERPTTVPLDETTNFTLTVLDILTGCTDDDTVRIVINTAANPIDAVNDNDTTLVNSAITVNVLGNDLNTNLDPLTVNICGSPSHGIIIINSDNTITYTPYPDYEGDDEFCYSICSTFIPSLCDNAQVYINVKKPSLSDLYAYSGISPNNDGINDVWKIRGIEKYPDNSVIIFNRWGDKLREFANYNNSTRSWDGRNEKGELLPDGTYFYILDVKHVGVLKGWIYIRGKE